MISYFLAISAGVLLVLAYPKINLTFLAFVGLVPLLLGIKQQPNKALTLGFLSGFVYFFLLLYWLIKVMTHYGGLPFIAACGTLALLSAYLAAYWAIGGYIFAKAKLYKISILNAISFASLMVLLEYLRGWFLGGFPWGYLGASQYKFLTLIQVADIGGIYLISFFVILTNYAVFSLISDKIKGLSVIVFTFLIFLLFLSYGYIRLNQKWVGPSIKVGIIQGNIPQDVKWSEYFLNETINRYFALSETAINQGAKIIIWPETALPFYFMPDQDPGKSILLWSAKKKISLIFGAPRPAFIFKRPKVYNSLFLVTHGKIIGIYDKQHLVPFGEYVPLENIFPFLRTFAVASGNYQPGPRGNPLRFAEDKIFGPLICFESVFPRLSARQVKKGATILIVATNDAWFDRTAGPYQHFTQAVFRAIETRRYLLRVANTGISGFISPTGKILYATQLEKPVVTCVIATFLSYLTVYTKYGKFCWLFYLVLVLPVLPRVVFGQEGFIWRKKLL